MDFRPVNFKLSLIAGVLLAAVVSAVAQSSDRSIIFSRPADHSATPEAADSRPIPGGPNPANQVSLFNPPDTSPGPLPTPPLPTDEQRQLQKDLQDRKDWTLLTPEEILGVVTPESILLPPDQQPDAAEKKLTPMERFMNRQEEARRQSSGTNGFLGGNDSTRWNPFQKQEESPDETRLDSVRATTANGSPYWKQLFNSTPDNNNNNNPAAGQGNAGTWSRPFGLGAPPASQAQVEAQKADMERFRQMLMPDATPADKMQNASPGGKFLYSTETLPGANPQPSAANAGFNTPASLSTVNDKPAEVAPLTGLSGQQLLKPATVARPLWAPQPPPWLSQTPQPFVAPQREF
jgi:hypothetical protein